MSYPHESYLLDWLKGMPIQYQDDSGWVDIPKAEMCAQVPRFYRHGVYRHKPVMLRYRLAQVDGHVVAVNTLLEAEAVSAYKSFVKWIDDDWVERPA